MFASWDSARKYHDPAIGKPTPRQPRPSKKILEIAASHQADPQALTFFFDEGRFGLKPVLGRYWARRALRPLATVEPGYKNFYVYSAVSPHSGEAFSLILPWVNTETMNVYLDYLAAAYPDRRILLIWDGAGWHGSQDLRIPSTIRCETLPPYSPELNPVERLWQWLRRHVTRNRLFDSEGALVDALAEKIAGLEAEALQSLCRCSYL